MNRCTSGTATDHRGSMATFVKTDAGTWRAIIRKQGWPITSKTFRIKRDATAWARNIEDGMVRGVYISRTGAERLTVKDALQRYLLEVTPTKKPTTQRSEKITAEHLTSFLGKYSMAASRVTWSRPIVIILSAPGSQTILCE